MKYNPRTLPIVHPMMARRIQCVPLTARLGGVLISEGFDSEDVGMADSRLEYDEDVVDCSNRIFEITTHLSGYGKHLDLCVFPSRRWRNHRDGEIINFDNNSAPFIYIGNPVRIFCDPLKGITVSSTPEFLIKSGPQLGY